VQYSTIKQQNITSCKMGPENDDNDDDDDEDDDDDDDDDDDGT
jgi:hypothetical protein